MLRFSSTRSLLLLAILVLPCWSQDSADFFFGDYQGVYANLLAPSAAVFDAQGKLYVAEAGAHRVQVLDQNGARQRKWGRWGNKPGRLREPSGLALVNQQVWVVDRGNHRLQIFSKKGRFHKVVGALGKAAGQFFQPTGLAFDAVNQRIAVADTGNARVQILNVAGQPLHVLEQDAEGGSLAKPVALAFDPNGNLYVVDQARNRIVRFDSNGNPLPSWGDYGPHFGLLDAPSACVWHGNQLWVADRKNHRLQAFQPDKGAVTLWGLHEITPHSGMGKLHYPDVLAIAPDGQQAVVGESIEHRLQFFAVAETEQVVQEALPSAGIRRRTHFGSYLDITENWMLAAEPENHYVFVFDLRRELPVIVNKFGERGSGLGLLNQTMGIAQLPARGEVVALDAINRRVQFFKVDLDRKAPLGFYPKGIGFSWGVSFKFFEEVGALQRVAAFVAVRPNGNGQLYLLDRHNRTIMLFDPASRKAEVVLPKQAGWPVEDPTDFVYDAANQRFLVVDRLNACVWDVHQSGTQFKKIGKRGKKKSRFSSPFGIALDAQHNIWVTDAWHDRVMQFHSNGRFIKAFGSRGDRMGQFWFPQGIAVDAKGRLIVIDRGNHRAQMFTAKGEWITTFGAGRAVNARNVPKGKEPLQ